MFMVFGVGRLRSLLSNMRSAPSTTPTTSPNPARHPDDISSRRERTGPSLSLDDRPADVQPLPRLEVTEEAASQSAVSPSAPLVNQETEPIGPLSLSEGTAPYVQPGVDAECGPIGDYGVRDVSAGPGPMVSVGLDPIEGLSTRDHGTGPILRPVAPIRDVGGFLSHRDATGFVHPPNGGGSNGSGGRFGNRYSGSDGFGGSSSSGPPLWVLFILMGIGYSLYQSAFILYQRQFGQRLAQFEYKQMGEPSNSGGGIVAPKKADITYRLWDGLTRCGWLVGGLLAGGDLARRAINVTILPPLRRIVAAILPRIVRSVLGPLMTVLGKVALLVWSPFSKLALFFGIIGSIFGSSSAHSLVPLMEPAILWAQSLFSAPLGYSAEVVFLAHNLKVTLCTVFFGGAVLQIKVFREEDKPRAFYVGVLLGTLAVFILLDRRFIYIFVSQYLIQAYPFIGEAVASPIVQISTVFASSIIIQSARFPPVVGGFYACLIVLSGIWRRLLFN